MNLVAWIVREMAVKTGIKSPVGGGEMFDNLAAKGVIQQGHPDIITVRQYHPEVLAKFGIVCSKQGESGAWLFTENGCSERIVSGYRSRDVDPAVKNSPHGYAIALDVWVSHLQASDPNNRPAILESAIGWVRAAVEPGLFTRAGLYPQQNTIHVDIADAEWIEKYHGTPYWVKWNSLYHGFFSLEEAISFARHLVTPRNA